MKILVVEDDPDMLDVTTYALRREGYNIVTATDGQQAIDRHLDERPDLVLLDVGLPRMNGFDVCRRIRETAATPIIMLTARNDDDNVVQGFLTGADDYVTKPFSHRQLAARIRAVLNRTHGGLTPEPEGNLTVGSLRLDMQSHEVSIKEERAVRLTPLEFRLLYMLAINEGRVVSASRLVEYAWGYEGGEASLVKTHISHVRQKLGLDKDRAGVEQPDDVRIRTVPWVGYSLTRVRGGSVGAIPVGA
jgi:two-component system, OmpR family, response regulator